MADTNTLFTRLRAKFATQLTVTETSKGTLGSIFEHVKERMDIARGYRFRRHVMLFHLAVVMVGDLEGLRSARTDTIRVGSMAARTLLYNFFMSGSDALTIVDATPQLLQPSTSPSAEISGTRESSTRSKEAACNYRATIDAGAGSDGRCVISGSPSAKECQIWATQSRAISTPKGIIWELEQTEYIFGQDLRRQLTALLAPPPGRRDAYGGLDEDWNFIPLATHLRHYWRKARFGLKWDDKFAPVTEDDTGLMRYQVEFWWLPSGFPKALQLAGCLLDDTVIPRGNGFVKFETEADMEKYLQVLEREFQNGSQASRMKHRDGWVVVDDCDFIESGQQLQLKVKPEDYEKVKAVIKGQWILMMVAAISGWLNNCP